MNNKTYIFILVWACLFSCVEFYAQRPVSFCNTPTPERLLKIDINEYRSQMQRTVMTEEVVEVFVHYTTNDAGTISTIDPAEFENRLNDTRMFFGLHNICFLVVGSQVIQDSDLDFHFIFGPGGQPDSNEQDEILPWLKPGVLNIFVHHFLWHNGVSGGGNAYAIPNNYLSIDDGAILCCESILAHEIGHCLGLYHTFQWRWGSNGQIRENVARTGECKNCESEGDLVCDTPADPNQLAFITTNDTTFLDVNAQTTDCVFNGFYLDNCDVIHNPDETNIMSYFPDSCTTNFTPDQGVRMISILNNQLPTLRAPETQNINQNGNWSFGEFFHTAKSNITYTASTLTYSNDAVLWSAAGNSITVQPGTTISPVNGLANLSAQDVCQ